VTTGSGAMTEAHVVERRAVWRDGGSLGRVVARAPVSVRVKLLVGFGVIVVLLIVGAVSGLLALRQSNSRVGQLRTEQQKATLVRALLTDATALKKFVDQRAFFTVGPGTKGDVTPPPNAYFVSLDSTIQTATGALNTDATKGLRFGGGTGLKFRPASLRRLYPALYTTLQSKLGKLDFAQNELSGPDGLGRGGYALPLVQREQRLANGVVAALGPVTRQARLRTSALVAEDRSSFVSSRNLLIGVSAGSVALALALGLLLSSSLLVPLRKTDARMAEIAAGDFTGHLAVPNRDELGTLAANVNHMNDELRRVYRELELASERKSQFLANMSHELRTPLNAIIGFSEVLHEQMFGELNERQLAYVDDVLEAGRHLLSLINDVLDLAKIEAGRMDLELSQIAIPDLLRSAVSMHSERASRDGIELNLTTEPEEITVTADERRVRQIVFNLLSNAIKFTPADGRVDVSARLDDGEVEVAVADTGAGIAAGELESIFEEFEQTSEGKEAGGTGLGLPLSRRLVELHGGRLWAESQPGHGSTFRFTLPVRQPSAA
jgi:signal transduction histidine kinase